MSVQFNSSSKLSRFSFSSNFLQQGSCINGHLLGRTRFLVQLFPMVNDGHSLFICCRQKWSWHWRLDCLKRVIPWRRRLHFIIVEWMTLFIFDDGRSISSHFWIIFHFFADWIEFIIILQNLEKICGHHHVIFIIGWRRLVTALFVSKKCLDYINCNL